MLNPLQAGWKKDSLETASPGAPLAAAGGSPGPLRVLRGTDADLRAMKRALANAPLGPTAVLALTGAILDLERVLADHEDESLRSPRPHRSA